MHLYVDTPRRERSQRRGGRSALVAAMRMRFEEAGVWTLMRKQIAVADYAPGDPLRIDCGYRFNGDARMFQAISLESDVDDAKVLAFSAGGLIAGVKEMEKAKLELTAIVEPIRDPTGQEPDEDRTLRYEYAKAIMKKHEIRMLTSSDLPGVAREGAPGAWCLERCNNRQHERLSDRWRGHGKQERLRGAAALPGTVTGVRHPS